jgi:Zn ribbon nucleic-acid-binding protein
MQGASRTLDPEDRANELYWGSDRSVNQIAEELDLSKGAFYGMIRPLAAGLGCPACGREVAHANRTAKERGLVDCLACGWRGSEDETLPENMMPGTRPVAAGPRANEPPVRSDASSAAEAAPPEHLSDGVALWRALAVGALLGGAVGLALVVWARRG